MSVLHALAGLAGVVIVAGATAGDRQVLYNDSPSVPLGFWLRADTDTGALTPGAVIAYRPPEAARAYVAAALPRYQRDDLLKPVAAAQGDEFCVLENGNATVNGRSVAQALTHDPAGRSLPRWRGCKRLDRGEVAVISTAIPNSFDSRYYGPVSSADIRGAYAPLWTW